MAPLYFSLPGPNGYEISLKEWEPDAAGTASGPRTLLCLHGFSGDKESSVIAAVADAMSRRGFRVVTFDWPGHGKSPADSTFLTVENCLMDLEAVSSWCKSHPVLTRGDSPAGGPLSCFATSFGGYLAMLYSGRHPGSFKRLLLRSPALRMAEVLKSFLTEEQLTAFRAGRKLDFGFTRPLLLDGSFLLDLEHADHDAFAVRPSGSGPSVAGAAVTGMGAAPAVTEAVFPAQIALIHGDADDVVPVLDSLMFAERNGLPLRIVHGADHRYKNPGELEQIVAVAEEFLDP